MNLFQAQASSKLHVILSSKFHDDFLCCFMWSPRSITRCVLISNCVSIGWSRHVKNDLNFLHKIFINETLLLRINGHEWDHHLSYGEDVQQQSVTRFNYETSSFTFKNHNFSFRFHFTRYSNRLKFHALITQTVYEYHFCAIVNNYSPHLAWKFKFSHETQLFWD